MAHWACWARRRGGGPAETPAAAGGSAAGRRLNRPRQLEIACNSLASAVAAQAGGADRVELCADLASGGTTPSAGTIVVVRQQVRLPLFVLVRPRAGDFVYDEAEVQVMLQDIALCRAQGCDGVVIGALTVEGAVDLAVCRRLLAAAGPLQVTFHRAFDAVRDRAAALEAVIALGCQRILSSGGAATALAGCPVLARDARQAGDRIAIMAGAGIDAGNVAAVVQGSGCQQLHASASTLRHSPVAWRNPALAGLQPDHVQTDVARVAALRAALDRLPG